MPTKMEQEAAALADAQPVIDVHEVSGDPLPRQSVAVAIPDPPADTSGLIPRHDELQVLAQLAVTFAQAGLVPKALQSKPADVLLVLMTGRGLGIDPLVALRECHPIEGKVTVSPKLKLAIVRQRGLGRVWPDPGNDDESAVWHAVRNDDPAGTEYTARYTMDDAKRAGLVGKDNWKKYPTQMLQWRALGYLLDIAFGEVGTGLYSADELGAMTDDEGRPVIDVSEVPPLAGIEPAAAKPPSTANEIAPQDEKDAIRDRIMALPPPAVQVLRDAWAKVGTDGTPQLWPLPVLPNRQVKAAHALINAIEKRAKTGEFGQWVGQDATTPATAAQAGPEAAPATEGAEDPSAGTGGAFGADPDHECIVDDCDEAVAYFDDDGVPWCAEHMPMTEGT